MDAEFQHKLGPVAVHGSYADVQDSGNFLVNSSPHKQLQHFHFSGRKRDFNRIVVQWRVPRQGAVLYTKWQFNVYAKDIQRPPTERPDARS
jgi:hypothetical protein